MGSLRHRIEVARSGYRTSMHQLRTPNRSNPGRVSSSEVPFLFVRRLRPISRYLRLIRRPDFTEAGPTLSLDVLADSANFGPILANAGPSLTNIGQMCVVKKVPTLGQAWYDTGPHCQTHQIVSDQAVMGLSLPMSTEVGQPHRATVVPESAELGRSWASTDRPAPVFRGPPSRKSNLQKSADYGKRGNVGLSRPKLGLGGPRCIQGWPNSAELRFQPSPNRQFATNVGHKSAEIASTWPNPAKSGQHRAKIVKA